MEEKIEETSQAISSFQFGQVSGAMILRGLRRKETGEGTNETHRNIVQQFGCEIESALPPQIALAPAAK